MRATQAFFEQTGGPEVIQWREVDLPAPGPGEVLLRHEAVGLNFIDTYFRTGLYPARLPSGMGMEAAGVVEAVGEGVTSVSPGSRVAYSGSPGAYSTARIIKASDLMAVPDDISAQTAAAILLKGCTVEMLAERCAPVDAGEWALVPAAAGGVGEGVKRRAQASVVSLASTFRRASAAGSLDGGFWPVMRRPSVTT